MCFYIDRYFFVCYYENMKNEFVIKNFPKLKLSYYNNGFTRLNKNWAYKNERYNHSICYYVHDGRFKLQTQEEELVVTPHTLVIIPAGLYFDTSCPFDDPATQYWLHFNMSIDGKELFENFPNFIVIRDIPSLEPLFEDFIKHSSDQDIYSHCFSMSCLYAIMGHVLNDESVLPFLSQQNSDYSFSQVVKYIQENYTTQLSVKTLAQMCHFNPSYFIRIFKRRLGVTPHQYIRQLQVERARNYLRKTTLPIKDIADAVGISDEKYFSKVFKAHTYLSPTEFRQKYTNRLDL